MWPLLRRVRDEASMMCRMRIYNRGSAVACELRLRGEMMLTRGMGLARILRKESYGSRYQPCGARLGLRL